MYPGMLRYLDNRAEKIDYIMSTKNLFYDEIRSSIEEVCFAFIPTLQHLKNVFSQNFGRTVNGLYFRELWSNHSLPWRYAEWMPANQTVQSPPSKEAR